MPAAIAPKHPMIRLWIRQERMPATTAAVARCALNGWFDFLQERDAPIALVDATRYDVDEYLDVLATTPSETTGKLRSAVTVNGVLVKLRSFYRWALANREVASNPATEVKRLDTQETLPPVLEDEALRDMIRSCGTDHNGRRDAAIMSLLRMSGLRRAEICGLDLDSYHAGDAPYLMVGTAENHTKSRKQRIAPLAEETADALDFYLLHRGDDAGALFLSRHSSTGRMTPSGITQLVDRARLRCGLSERIGIHSFRRAAAIAMREAGMSDAAIMDICGWKGEAQLVHYTKRAATKLAHAEYAEKMARTKLAPARPQPKGKKRAA